MRRMKGLALIAVLWAVALLSIMAGSFSLSLQRDAGLLNTLQDRARGLALADAGLHYTLLMLSLPDPKQRWRASDELREIHLPGGWVRLRVLDEGGKIDINGAQEATLRALLTKQLDDPDQATALADAILDWRDADELKRLHGAEAGDYIEAGKGYAPSNTNFQTLEELHMVLGMTPALYSRLEPLLTTHSGQDGINPALATREALLGLPGLDEQTVDSYLMQRANTPPDLPPPPLTMPPGGVRLHQAANIAFGVTIEARTPDGAMAGLKVVVRRQRARNGLPLAIVEWKPQSVGALRLFDTSPTTLLP